MQTQPENYELDPNFAVVCSFLEKFGGLLGSTYEDISIDDLKSFLETEEVLVKDNDVHVILKLHLRLLRGIGQSTKGKDWFKGIAKFCKDFPERDDRLIWRVGYENLPAHVKIRILKNLCEDQFEYNDSFNKEVNEQLQEEGEIRHFPVGKDKLGRTYWFIRDETGDVRVYRSCFNEVTKDERWALVCSNDFEVKALIDNLEDEEEELEQDDELLPRQRSRTEIQQEEKEHHIQQHCMVSVPKLQKQKNLIDKYLSQDIIERYGLDDESSESSDEESKKCVDKHSKEFREKCDLLKSQLKDVKLKNQADEVKAVIVKPERNIENNTVDNSNNETSEMKSVILKLSTDSILVKGLAAKDTLDTGQTKTEDTSVTTVNCKHTGMGINKQFEGKETNNPLNTEKEFKHSVVSTENVSKGASSTKCAIIDGKGDASSINHKKPTLGDPADIQVYQAAISQQKHTCDTVQKGTDNNHIPKSLIGLNTDLSPEEIEHIAVGDTRTCSGKGKHEDHMQKPDRVNIKSLQNGPDSKCSHQSFKYKDMSEEVTLGDQDLGNIVSETCEKKDCELRKFDQNKLNEDESEMAGFEEAIKQLKELEAEGGRLKEQDVLLPVQELSNSSKFETVTEVVEPETDTEKKVIDEALKNLIELEEMSKGSPAYNNEMSDCLSPSEVSNSESNKLKTGNFDSEKGENTGDKLKENFDLSSRVTNSHDKKSFGNVASPCESDSGDVSDVVDLNDNGTCSNSSVDKVTLNGTQCCGSDNEDDLKESGSATLVVEENVKTAETTDAKHEEEKEADRGDLENKRKDTKSEQREETACLTKEPQPGSADNLNETKTADIDLSNEVNITGSADQINEDNEAESVQNDNVKETAKSAILTGNENGIEIESIYIDDYDDDDIQIIDIEEDHDDTLNEQDQDITNKQKEHENRYASDSGDVEKVEETKVCDNATASTAGECKKEKKEVSMLIDGEMITIAEASSESENEENDLDDEDLEDIREIDIDVAPYTELNENEDIEAMRSLYEKGIVKDSDTTTKRTDSANVNTKSKATDVEHEIIDDNDIEAVESLYRKVILDINEDIETMVSFHKMKIPKFTGAAVNNETKAGDVGHEINVLCSLISECIPSWEVFFLGELRTGQTARSFVADNVSNLYKILEFNVYPDLEKGVELIKWKTSAAKKLRALFWEKIPSFRFIMQYIDKNKMSRKCKQKQSGPTTNTLSKVEPTTNTLPMLESATKTLAKKAALAAQKHKKVLENSDQIRNLYRYSNTDQVPVSVALRNSACLPVSATRNVLQSQTGVMISSVGSGTSFLSTVPVTTGAMISSVSTHTSFVSSVPAACTTSTSPPKTYIRLPNSTFLVPVVSSTMAETTMKYTSIANALRQACLAKPPIMYAQTSQPSVVQNNTGAAILVSVNPTNPIIARPPVYKTQCQQTVHVPVQRPVQFIAQPQVTMKNSVVYSIEGGRKVVLSNTSLLPKPVAALSPIIVSPTMPTGSVVKTGLIKTGLKQKILGSQSKKPGPASKTQPSEAKKVTVVVGKDGKHYNKETGNLFQYPDGGQIVIAGKNGKFVNTSGKEFKMPIRLKGMPFKEGSVYFIKCGTKLPKKIDPLTGRPKEVVCKPKPKQGKPEKGKKGPPRKYEEYKPKWGKYEKQRKGRPKKYIEEDNESSSDSEFDRMLSDSESSDNKSSSDNDGDDFDYDTLSRRIKAARANKLQQIDGKKKNSPQDIEDWEETELDTSGEQLVLGRNAKRAAARKCLNYSEPSELVLEEVSSDDEQIQEESIDPCTVCDHGDKPHTILLCDRCDSGYHMACLTPPLQIVPLGDWFCPICEHGMLIDNLKMNLQQVRKKKWNSMRKGRYRPRETSYTNRNRDSEDSSNAGELENARFQISQETFGINRDNIVKSAGRSCRRKVVSYNERELDNKFKEIITLTPEKGKRKSSRTTRKDHKFKSKKRKTSQTDQSSEEESASDFKCSEASNSDTDNNDDTEAEEKPTGPIYYTTSGRKTKNISYF